MGLRGGTVALASATAAVAASAALFAATGPASADQRPSQNPGMACMHQLTTEGDPGMARMHKRTMTGSGMHGMHSH